jgi:hypothetical protein
MRQNETDLSTALRPTVNINGTDRDSLKRAALEIAHELLTLRGKIQQATPHGRDYQGADPLQFEIDRMIYRKRVEALDALLRAFQGDAYNVVEVLGGSALG